MSCCGGRDKGPPEHTQKWEYITLSDFKSTSAWNVPAYMWLWIMALTAVAVYVVDTMTAVNLLAFDKWSSEIKPAIDIKYSKWIFAGCILLSWALCIYEWVRALRVIKRGGVAESYMDPLAVSLQSMRGQGWRRFLVFSELTKSKKGADYIALFVYFSFKGAVRIILAEGPRQAVNAMSLLAVMQAKLVPHGSTNVSSFEQFWINLGDMTNTNKMQAIIFFSMLFTLVIWVISAISLLVAAIFYILFLWHYIPQSDGRLSIYCRRKIDRRLEKIVEHKIIAANEEEERSRIKYAKKIEALQMKSGNGTPLPPPKLVRAPTLPQIGDSPDPAHGEPKMGLSRQDTNSSISTLPQYSNRAGIQNELTSSPGAYGDPDDYRPRMPTRSATQASAMSYASNAPLLANAGFAGGEYRGAPTPGHPLSNYGRPNSSRARMGSQGTIMSQQSFTSEPPRYATPGPPRNAGTPLSKTPGPSRNGTPGPNGYRGGPEDSFVPQVPTNSHSIHAHPPDAMADFDFGISSATTDDNLDRGSQSLPHGVPNAAPYKPLILQPITTTWQKAYSESPTDITPSQPPSGQVASPLNSRQPHSSTPYRIEPTHTYSSPEAYEMNQRPQHTSKDSLTPAPASVYVAFKPNQTNSNAASSTKTASLPSLHIGRDSPARSISPMSTSSATRTDYFSSTHASASLIPPDNGDHRLTVLGYGDILDEYGTDRASTPGSQRRSRAPSPMQGPLAP